MSEIFLDTETTGLSFQDGHKIVEIACVETKDLIPTNKIFPDFSSCWHLLCHPPSSWSMEGNLMLTK